jgi:hypothetical protein
VAAEQVAELGRRRVRLSSARLDLREVERREGEVLLARAAAQRSRFSADDPQSQRPRLPSRGR